MRPIKIIGLCLTVAFAISAVAVASASAELPEYGRCVKDEVSKKGVGIYKTAACDTAPESGKGYKYEWEAGAGPGNGFTSKGGAGTLETKGGKTVTCVTENSTGEFVKGGNNKTEKTTVNFTGCKSAGQACTTVGDATGELTTNPLVGEEGWENTAKTKVALNLAPASGEFFIKFSCVGLKVEVKKFGSGILVPIKGDKMTLTEKLKYKATKGVQKPDQWAPTGSLEKAYLESSFEGLPFEQSGQTIESVVTGEEKLELRYKA